MHCSSLLRTYCLFFVPLYLANRVNVGTRIRMMTFTSEFSRLLSTNWKVSVVSITPTLSYSCLSTVVDMQSRNS